MLGQGPELVVPHGRDARREIALRHASDGPINQRDIRQYGAGRAQDSRDRECHHESAHDSVSYQGAGLGEDGALLEEADEAVEIALEYIAQIE